MWTSAKKALARAPFLDLAETFARRLRDELNGQVHSIVLYGSVARGEVTDHSDIDLMALVEQKSEALCNRVTHLQMETGGLDLDYGYVQTFLVSAAEAQRYKVEPIPLMLEVARDGIPLYDDGAYAALRERVLMTGPDNERFAREDLEMAEEMLRDARLMLDHGSWGSAVDRAYYVMHHSAKATLWGRPERMPHSHQGITIQFAAHLVRTGLADARFSAYLENGWTRRLYATYARRPQITEDTAQTMVRWAEEFLEWARELLGRAEQPSQS